MHAVILTIPEIRPITDRKLLANWQWAGIATMDFLPVENFRDALEICAAKAAPSIVMRDDCVLYHQLFADIPEVGLVFTGEFFSAESPSSSLPYYSNFPFFACSESWRECLYKKHEVDKLTLTTPHLWFSALFYVARTLPLGRLRQP